MKGGSQKASAMSEVILNVYDTSPSDSTTYYCGFGRFHSGIVTYGKEYIYTMQDGITNISPESGGVKGYVKFRKSVKLGMTGKTKQDVDTILEEMENDFQPEKYDPISRNGNHFCDALSMKLCRRTIPDWVSAMTDIVGFFNYYPLITLFRRKRKSEI